VVLGQGILEAMVSTDLATSYRGKTVLVTGDTGFKGSWLATWLLELGARVIGYALPPTSPRDNYVVSGLAERITHLDGDVRDHDLLAQAIAEHRPDAVFHLAAQPLVLESYKDPRATFETNVMGTVNVLEAVRHVPSVRAVVIVTSDKCYENQTWIWGYRETDAMGGHDPYSASKGAAELITQSMRRSFFTGAGAAAIATVRAGNVIGAGDWALHRIVPDCVRSLAAGEPIVIRHPKAVRPWQHVLDALHGYLQLGARLASDGAASPFASGWNFGPTQQTMVPVVGLVDAFIAAWGSGNFRIDRDPNAPDEARFLHLDISKALNLLGWRPALGLEDMVAFTVEGYRAELAQTGGVFDHRVAQIRAFEDVARG
jgi:CDP-glucose 4,6-dehydratase